MIKVIALVKKRSDLTMEEFERIWTKEHTPLAVRLGQKPYRVNIIRSAVDADRPAPFDGTAEMYWPSEEAFRAALASPAGLIAGKDVANFAEQVQLVIVDEHVITD